MGNPEEHEYRESEDEDFKPESAAAEDNVTSSDEEDTIQSVAKMKDKAPIRRPERQDDELDSGDEATIQESRRRKKRRKGPQVEEDSGGEGGLIKTRAQRAAEKQERAEHARTNKGDVTIDVDEVWAQLMSTPVGRPRHDNSRAIKQDELDLVASEIVPSVPQPQQLDESEFVTIKHAYEFAGQTVSEEKQVHRDSAEAKLFLASNSALASVGTAKTINEDGEPVRRPLKRASIYEPNPTGEVKGLPAHRQRLRTPSRADVLALQKRATEEAKALGDKAQRLNTVQKSKLDWVSHVDAEGLQDELDEYGRSKQGYLQKMDFLQNVQERRDKEERQARLQGVH